MYDIVVVGAGSAGCALAGRLAAHRSVALLEAGPADQGPRDVAAVGATGASYPVELRSGVRAEVVRGRGLGGSSAVNGANWVWATPADATAWGWTWPELVRRYERCATYLDVPGRGSGPIPVRRPQATVLHPVVDRFLDAAVRLGFPAEPDRSGFGVPGAGVVPSNSVDGVRIDTATAYGVRARTGATVTRVLFDGSRARGVELTDGSVIEAAEVVLSAGAIETPRLLLRSGIGPAAELRVPVVADLPGVGRDWSDHPAVFVPFAHPDPPADPRLPSSPVALDWDAGADPAGDVEVLAFVRPFTPGGPLHLMCTLQAPDSRGTLTADTITYGYLRTEHDRRRLRHAIRVAAELLRAGVGTRLEPAGDVLGNDRALDGWIAAHLTTAMHLCGSAGIGRVVDAQLRVLGVAGLRVADTSILPTVPRRGPAATAVAIGELAAELAGA